MALPLAVLMVWWLVRLLPDRPLLQLAGAQLAVHVALGLTAACPADPHEPPLLMTYGHVLAIVALRFGADRVLNVLDGHSRRSAALLRTVVDRWLSRPEPTCWVWLCASQRPTASPFVLSAEQAVAPGRGPPALRCP